MEFPLLNGSEEILLNDRSFTAAELGGEVLDGKAILVLGAGSYVMQ